MQTITREMRSQVSEISAEIRRIDEAIQMDYTHIANCKGLANSKPCDMYDQDIARRETDIQRMMLRRMDLTLKIRKINHNLPMRRHHIH